MTGFKFDWDEAKNLANQRKHGLSFEVASQVFRDPLFVSVKDRVEDGEQRWRTFGMVKRRTGALLLLVVAHTFHDELDEGQGVEVIRIISARTATRQEVKDYEDENG